MKYIQLKGDFGLETVDEFETMKEAKEMLIEYRMIGDRTSHYYISSRPCKDWKDSQIKEDK